MELLVGDFDQSWGERNFQTENWECQPTQGNNDIVVIIVKIAYQKFWLLRARFSHTKIFLSTPGPLLMGTLTTRLITY